MTSTLLARRHFITLVSLIALPGLSSQGRAQTVNPWAGITSVEVFCNSAMLIEPVASPPFTQTIYRLDAMDQTLQAVNARMNQAIAPGNEQQARQWALAHQAELKRTLSPLAASTVNALNRSRYYRIDRLPAIVINQRSVVYGVTGVAEAIARYQTYRQGGR